MKTRSRPFAEGAGTGKWDAANAVRHDSGFLVLCLFRAPDAMIVRDVQRHGDTAGQLHSFGACTLRMKRLG